MSKARLPLAALMIGSMSPDFAYFLPIAPGRAGTHDIAGLFYFCWPVGVAVWLLFVRVLEQPTMALLPETWRMRITPSDQALNLKTLALAFAAIILGAATHIVWDWFTHASTPVVDAFPAMRAVAFNIGAKPIRWFSLLQILSSIAGMAVLMVWAIRKIRGAPLVPAVRESRHWPSISNEARFAAVVFLFATSCVFALTGYVANPEMRFEGRLFHLAIGAMTGWALAWFAIALSIRWRSRTAR
jgi:hypothetical protein